MPEDCVVFIYHQSIPNRWHLFNCIVPANTLLTWTTLSNVAYRLEFNPSLAPSNWNALAGDVIATSNTASKLDLLTTSNRFYRVRVLP